MRLVGILSLMFTLGGCAVAALPFRLVSDVVGVVPVVGPVVAAPFEATAEVID